MNKQTASFLVTNQVENGSGRLTVSVLILRSLPDVPVTFCPPFPKKWSFPTITAYQFIKPFVSYPEHPEHSCGRWSRTHFPPRRCNFLCPRARRSPSPSSSAGAAADRRKMRQIKHMKRHNWTSAGQPPDLDPPDPVLSSEFTPVFQPADGRHWVANGRAAKADCVACRDGVQLLLHALGVSPDGNCADKHQQLMPCSQCGGEMLV